MTLLSKFNHIPFKYVLGMNLAILVMAVTFVSINTVASPTENRSQASETPLPSPVSQITVDPAHPPRLFNSEPDWAKVGDAILIHGENLGTVPFGSMTLGNLAIPVQNIVDWTPDHIVITIPDKAISARLTISFNFDQILQTSLPIRIVTANESGL